MNTTVQSPDLFDWKKSKRRTRTDQLLDAFAKFHENNPEVWMLFQKFAFEVIKSGRIAYSARAISHRIRWHVEIQTRGSELKLNDHTTPYYARMFHISYPKHDGFFRNRRLTSEDDEAYRNDVQVFHSGDPADEETITTRLTSILKTTTA